MLVREDDVPPGAVYPEAVLRDDVAGLSPQGALPEEVHRNRANRLQRDETGLSWDACLLLRFALRRFERGLVIFPTASDTLPIGRVRRASDSLRTKWTFDLSIHRAASGRHISEANTNRLALSSQVHCTKSFDNLC